MFRYDASPGGAVNPAAADASPPGRIPAATTANDASSSPVLAQPQVTPSTVPLPAISTNASPSPQNGAGYDGRVSQTFSADIVKELLFAMVIVSFAAGIGISCFCIKSITG
ncbi:hypothetical protein CYMTET_25074 [Cymbomonas tetramitiformis]|uniref:Transmembrane protein n=1 Tax=Cymbomonas tetramitiformis TaxID=36881 RepID=A0AAE0BZL5_9CHLO|nr:hypothetical protein CYMTET_44759 [Cymbomonas tetramitiformis]KAK3266295.1 hypothetical protein CYMTET_25074 [Cymbomonas tetramitiformis]